MISGVVLGLALQAADVPPEPDFAVDPAAEAAGDGDPATLNTGANPAAAEAEAPSGPIIQPAPVPDIPRDTPVRLMVLNEVSTKDHEPGHKFKLRVDAPVLVDGEEVIPVGTIAWGELLTAEKSGNVGRSGKLSARLLHIDLDGREIPIDGEASADGKSGKGETIMGVIGLGVLGLFAKGNNAKLKAGEKMTAFVADDVMLDNPSDAGS
ncbi:hypothetical protein [Erythrobacter sp. JK5]|uniref:hypothetical protein n=1 Tax=Erythrobacter sp. JK5 TaxID=2829500 RepID=UPI001BA5E2D9|nr:hypothetical protein [Erythrobacter sp. JK5]QUL37738.1 hypothetical protein KDC96_15595 [Erythrobacter sp. JK5]